eukprot:12904084-Prorocentrum_lima.AAC.1
MRGPPTSRSTSRARSSFLSRQGVATPSCQLEECVNFNMTQLLVPGIDIGIDHADHKGYPEGSEWVVE